MSKCDLTIELDEPERAYRHGETVHGTVVVHTDTEVNCRALELRRFWSTHGRGNSTTGGEQTITLFSGSWDPDRQYRYPFSVEAIGWPPTYHGHYLNVDHFLEARARIPWAFDPKTRQSYRVLPASPDALPEEVKPEPHPMAKAVGCVVGVVFLGFFALVLVNPFFLGFLLLVGLGGGLWALFTKVLPRRRLGEVNLELSADNLRSGDLLRGALSIRPKKPVAINGIHWEIKAIERCISGSGSSRTTHIHELINERQPLAGETTLQPGQLHRFPLQYQLPAESPYTIDLSDNQLQWEVEVRVDIPRWPDWKQTETVQVLPPAEGEGSVPGAASETDADRGRPGAELSIGEAAGYLLASEDDPDQVSQIVDAIQGLDFQLSATIERRLLAAADPLLERGGRAAWALLDDPPLPLILYFSADQRNQLDQLDGDRWAGHARVVGYDAAAGRLQMRVE